MQTVMDPVRAAIQKHCELKGEENERSAMQIADQESKAARHYLKLQIVLLSLDTQKHALGTLVAMTGVLDPHPRYI